TPRTLTWVTLPLLSTLRVAAREDEVQPPTAALPADSRPEVIPRLAAAATPTDRRPALRTTPRMLTNRCICSPPRNRRDRGRRWGPARSPPVRRPFLRDDDRDAGDEARVRGARGRDVRRGGRRKRAAHLGADRGAGRAGQLDLVRLALAGSRDAGEVHLA